MGLLKLGIKGMLLMLFLFIGISMLSTSGVPLFSPMLLGVGGLMLMLCMGFVEASFVFYE